MIGHETIIRNNYITTWTKCKDFSTKLSFIVNDTISDKISTSTINTTSINIPKNIILAISKFGFTDKIGFVGFFEYTWWGQNYFRTSKASFAFNETQKGYCRTNGMDFEIISIK